MCKKYKVGYTTGVFDMFHIGHLNILRRAKEMCDYLIVGVTTDDLSMERKRKKPIINENDRMAIVQSVRYVDKVVPQNDMDKLAAVKEHGADVVFVGSDWKGTPSWERYEKDFAAVGCDVVYLDHTDGISSTILRDRLNDTTYKYMRKDLDDKYGILPLQNKILEIMVYIDKFCKEHGIVYYLMGGSALGAMRHGGFIPWDDDLDIFMDAENYWKFLACAEKELDTDKYYLQRENSYEQPHFFSKIRANNTACIELVNSWRKGVHQGIFVDIMCLNNAAPTLFGKKVQYYAAGLLKARAITINSHNTYKASGKKKLELFIAKWFVRGPVKKLLLHLVRKYNKAASVELTHLFGRAKFSNSFYPVEDFGKQRLVPFENAVLAVPSKVEDYLTIRYGKDYMKMPSEETKAIYQSHATTWSVEKDYKEFLD